MGRETVREILSPLEAPRVGRVVGSNAGETLSQVVLGGVVDSGEVLSQAELKGEVVLWGKAGVNHGSR